MAIAGTLRAALLVVGGLVIAFFVAGTGLGGAGEATGVAPGSGRDARFGYVLRVVLEEDGLLSGTLVVSTSRAELVQDWGTESQFFAQADAMLPVDAEELYKTDTYRRDGRVGKEYAYRDVAPERFARAGMLRNFVFVHLDSGQWRMEGRLDMAPDTQQVLDVIGRDTRAAVRVTFPGRVVTVQRGVKDDDERNTVVYAPRFGDDYTVTAVSEDGGRNWASFFSTAFAALLVLGVLGLIVFAILRQRRLGQGDGLD